MADGSEAVRDWDLATVEVGDMVTPSHYSEVLLPEERVLADKLTSQLLNSIQKLNFLKKPIAKMVARRLIEKLQMANLGEDSVGVIAERVWWRLITVGGLGDGVPPDGLDPHCSGNEVTIAEDILHRVEGRAFLLIKDAWAEIVEAAGPEVSSKVIRAVAREAWPKVRESLAV